MTASAPNLAHAELERLLATATRKVRRAAWRAALPAATWQAAGLLLLAAFGYALVSLVRAARGAETSVSPPLYIVILLLALWLPYVRVTLAVLRRHPSLREVAERLDLGAGEHNRIAIAVAFTRETAPSDFALAAIADGLAAAHRLAAATPYAAAVTLPWRRIAGAGALFLLLNLAAQWRFALPTWQDRGTPAPASLAATTSDRPSDAGARRDPPPNPPAPPPRTSTAAAAPGTPTEVARATPAGQRTIASTGGAARGTSAQAVFSEQPVGMSGEASGGAGSPAAKRSARPPRKSAPVPPPVDSPESNKAQTLTSEQSSATPGSAAGLCRSPVQHNWSQRDATEAEPQDTETDEPTPDESRNSSQRGGVQPSLKDRNDSPTRELGISSDQGMPGAGRGGPTPPKKSRGTASLVLGVPVPDFVRGRMGPGPTKVTQERVPPAATPGDAAQPAPAAARAAPESPLPRWEIPAGFAARVRDYLIALHTQAAATAAPAPSPQPQE
jgi:hypothetical protein